MSVTEEITKLSADALIELFVLDASALGGTVSRFHSGTNGIRRAIVWQGVEYQPWTIQIAGFEHSGTGKLPRPTLTVGNVAGVIGALARDYNDLLNAKLTRKRTFMKYLDNENFPTGYNPTADPNAQLPDDVYYVDQKTHEDNVSLEFTLAAKMDLEGVAIPQRVIVTTCAWQYRGEGCGYSGGAVADINDVPTSDNAKDSCSKHLTGCKLRFGAHNVLPFGGFPGASILR